VTDTGIGIPADEQTQVFERFRKGSNVKSGQGVGLGLSLVRDVVELHGGSTELTSAIGEGTTVTIRLPRTTAKTSS
jgi:signal transduction histidine kinase